MSDLFTPGATQRIPPMAELTQRLPKVESPARAVTPMQLSGPTPKLNPGSQLSRTWKAARRVRRTRRGAVVHVAARFALDVWPILVIAAGAAVSLDRQTWYLRPAYLWAGLAALALVAAVRWVLPYAQANAVAFVAPITACLYAGWVVGRMPAGERPFRVAAYVGVLLLILAFVVLAERNRLTDRSDEYQAATRRAAEIVALRLGYTPIYDVDGKRVITRTAESAIRDSMLEALSDREVQEGLTGFRGLK